MKISEICEGRLYVGEDSRPKLVCFINHALKTVDFAVVGTGCAYTDRPLKSFARWAVRDITGDVLAIANQQYSDKNN